MLLVSLHATSCNLLSGVRTYTIASDDAKSDHSFSVCMKWSGLEFLQAVSSYLLFDAQESKENLIIVVSTHPLINDRKCV